MKKIYCSVLALCAAFTLNAQQTIGLEGVNLSADFYNNGSSGSGGFIEDGVVFTNDYNSAWDSWNGFSVSNTTDVTTAGYGNQYSAYAGGGAASSTNYAVFYSNGSISFAGQGVDLSSVQLTNTTYAGLSMKDGDMYSKQFGSPNDANGTPDGTNGADFFKVWIFAHAEDGSKMDSIEYYLADYRFTDNSLDYIKNTWETVDLSTIVGTVYALSFKLESSDNGAWGMNTPAYFALDNLVINKNIGLQENERLTVEVFPNPIVNELHVKGENGTLELFDVTGQLVLSTQHNLISVVDVSQLASGSYLLKLTNEKGTAVQTLVK